MANDPKGDLSPEDLLLLGAIDGLPKGERIRALRAMLLARADQIERFEMSFLEALRDSVHTASQNIQDVRIHDLEIRVDQLENPKASPLRDIAVDMLLILSIELVLVAAPHFVVYGALGANLAVSGLKRMRATKRAMSVKFAKQKKNILDIEDEIIRAQQDLYVDYISWQPKIRLHRLEDNLRQLRKELEETRVHIEIFDSIAEYSPKDDAALSIKDGNLRKLVDAHHKFKETVASTAQGRLGETLGEGVQELITATPATDAPAVVLTSRLCNGLLAMIAMDMDTARASASAVRNALHIVDDNTLVDSDLGASVLFEAASLRSEGLPGADLGLREALVYGVEAYLWFQIFNYGGLLRKKSIEVEAYEKGTVRSAEGVCLVTVHVEPDFERIDPERSLFPVPRKVEATLYVGAMRLSDFMAKYLHDRFADSIMQTIGSVVAELPSKYSHGGSRYGDVLKEPEYIVGIIPNIEKQKKTDELRVVVVEAFIALGQWMEDKRDLRASMAISQVVTAGDVGTEAAGNDAINESTESLRLLQDLGDALGRTNDLKILLQGILQEIGLFPYALNEERQDVERKIITQRAQLREEMAELEKAGDVSNFIKKYLDDFKARYKTNLDEVDNWKPTTSVWHEWQLYESLFPTSELANKLRRRR